MGEQSEIYSSWKLQYAQYAISYWQLSYNILQWENSWKFTVVESCNLHNMQFFRYRLLYLTYMSCFFFVSLVVSIISVNSFHGTAIFIKPLFLRTLWVMACDSIVLKLDWTYVARTLQHWIEHDKRTCDDFLKIHMTCLPRHASIIGVSVLHSTEPKN